MAYPIAVLSADWHLERHAWARHPLLCGDSYYGLTQVVDFCLREKLPLIAAGDLFNEPYPEAHTVWQAARQMERMKKANLHVYFVQGQHEKTRDTPWMTAFHDWPTHVDQKEFWIGQMVDIGGDKKFIGRKFYGLDYVRGEEDAKAALAKIPPGTDALVAHQVWLDVMGQRCGPECAVADVPNVSMIITGDYHKHMLIKGAGSGNQPVTLVSPGPLCLQSLSEEPKKSFYVLCDDMSVRTVKLKCRSLLKFKLKTALDLDWFAKNVVACIEEETQPDLPEQIRKPIVDVEFEEELENAYSVITSTVGDKAHLFWSRNRAGNTLVQPSENKIGSAEKSLETGLLTFCKAGSKIHNITMALLSTDNPLQLLEQLSEVELAGEEKK